MKLRLFLTMCFYLFILSIAGCGNGGGEGLNGAVTVTGSQATANSSSDVSFLVSYTNPTETNLIGVKIDYSVSLNGVVFDSGSFNTNNSGSTTLGPYSVQKTSTEQKVRCSASSANLNGNAVVTIAALGALSVSPATQTFTSTQDVNSTTTFTITGGSSPYNVTSSNTGLVSVTTSGTTVIATRQSSAAGSVTITVTDSAGSSVDVQLTLQAVAP